MTASGEGRAVPNAKLSDREGSGDDIRRESEFLFRCYSDPFAGAAEIATFSREEMLATKLRALLQRNKGRDLFDLAHALQVFDELNTDRVVACFGQYLDRSQVRISRAERSSACSPS